MTRRDSSEGTPGSAAGEQSLKLPDYAGWTAEDGSAGLDLDRMQAELQGQLARERGIAAWLRSRPTPVRATLAGLVLGLLVVTTMLLWPRPDYTVYPPARMLLALAPIAGLLAVELVLVMWPLQLPAAPRWLVNAALIGPPLVLAGLYALPPAHTDHPRSLVPDGFGSMLAGTVRCLVVGSLLGAGVFALFRALDRGGARRRLLMAAGAGLAANLLLQLHCAVTAPSHLLIGHFGVLALCFAVAAVRPND